MSAVRQALLGQLSVVRQRASMWGSPREVEAVGLHLLHVLRSSTFAQTQRWYENLGGPFAGDLEEHQAMQRALWGDEGESEALAQVLAGFGPLWGNLEKEAERTAQVGPWVEAILTTPVLVGPADQLQAVLFALLGFCARSAPVFTEALSAKREAIGGHRLRPFHVVGPRGETSVALPYGRKFTTFATVSEGLGLAASTLPME